MSKNLLVIRADADVTIGSGHVMRCLTLAEAMRESGALVVFVCRSRPGNLNDLIINRGFMLHELAETEGANVSAAENGLCNEYTSWLGVPQKQDATETIAALAGKEVDWLIVDHYGLDRRWEEELRPHVRKIMVIDDLADRPHDCDILLDQNFFQKKGVRYEGLVPPSCTLLLGPTYALLRPEFVQARKKRTLKNGEIHRVFVFCGGSDPDNVSGRVLAAMSSPELHHLELDMVLGKGNPHLSEIEQQIAIRPHSRLHVQVDNMAELMAQADLALGAGGCTTWERLCLGLPSLVITVAANQESFTRDLHREGFLTWLGGADTVDTNTIKKELLRVIRQNVSSKQSLRSMALVPGDGTIEVSELLRQGVRLERWHIREADADDSALYWYWVNDPVVRRNAFKSEFIPWEEHNMWFRGKIDDPDALLLLVDSDIGPIGQVRFEKQDQHVTVDYSIARQFRGCGLGVPLLAKAIEVWRKTYDISLYGDVKITNEVSSRIFAELGFREVPPRQKDTKHFQLRFCLTKTLG
ncbi:MAG: UDP-2,4-diacetamido-2,4,6-trideoxy-beta-L-altropyranose hydrolase [Desulfurivibrionaceae bacterium]